MSVGERTVRGWLSRIDKDAKAKRDATIVDLYQACYTQAEIAERVGCDQAQVARVLYETAELPYCRKPTALYQEDDWSPPLYNVWKQQTKSGWRSSPSATRTPVVKR